MAEQSVPKRGHPVTRTEDWESIHKWICLLNVTFERWRALKWTKTAEWQLRCIYNNLPLCYSCTQPIYIQDIHYSTSKCLTPPSDQLYQKYGRLLPLFLFTCDIEICNTLCLTSFVYRIFNGSLASAYCPFKYGVNISYQFVVLYMDMCFHVLQLF